MDFLTSYHQWIVLLLEHILLLNFTVASLPLQPPSRPVSSTPSTFSPGLLAALLDLPAADSSQGDEQHQQTHGQANSYPQSHRGERDVLTWSKGQRERRGRKRERERESLIIHSCSAKIEAQLSPLHPSPLFHHLTIQLLRVRPRQKKKKNPELSGLQNY